jgi:hypothetical protein
MVHRWLVLEAKAAVKAASGAAAGLARGAKPAGATMIEA